MSTTREIINYASELELLAFEIARNAAGPDLPVEALLSDLNVPTEQFLQLCADPQFKALIRAYKKEFEDNGVSFQLKAGIIAEDGLKQLHRLINDADEIGSTRLKALEKAVDWSGLAPKNADPANTGAAAPQIVFNFPAGTPVPTNVTIGSTVEGEKVGT